MVEVLIASSIMLIITMTTMMVVQKGISISHQSLHATQASFLLEEGGEAVRMIRDNAWSNISGLSTSLTYYLTLSMTWTARNAAEANGWKSVTYGNGLFVAVAYNGTNRVMTSPDGINWTARAAPLNTWTSVTYGNGMFVAVASGGTNRVMTSPDGIVWTERSSALETNMWTSVTYGNGLFVAVAFGAASEFTNKVMTSPDGIVWTERTLPVSTLLYSVTYGNGLFVAVGNNGKIITSPDGISWTLRFVAVAGNLVSVAYGNGQFVSFEGAGTGAYSSIVSTDGINWTVKSYAVQNYANFIAYGNGVFLVSDGSSSLKSSTDGINWTTETAVSGSYWNSIICGNGLFVGVASSGTNRVMTSSGGTWVLVTTPNTIDRFVRSVNVANVNRDASTGDIVSNGGTLDTGTRLITINISWSESGKTITKNLPFYISNIFQ